MRTEMSLPLILIDCFLKNNTYENFVALQKCNLIAEKLPMLYTISALLQTIHSEVLKS